MPPPPQTNNENLENLGDLAKCGGKRMWRLNLYPRQVPSSSKIGPTEEEHLLQCSLPSFERRYFLKITV